MSEGAAAAVQSVPVSLVLPLLQKDHGPRSAVSRLQHIFNDFARSDDDPPPFDESGVFGPKTDGAVREFQKFNGLQVDGQVGSHTWKALLEQWMRLDLSD
jgi:murein L,D-transpeptidase YcbB/YkuD